MYGNNQIVVSHIKIYRYISQSINIVARNESPEDTKQVPNNAKESKTWKPEEKKKT